MELERLPCDSGHLLEFALDTSCLDRRCSNRKHGGVDVQRLKESVVAPYIHMPHLLERSLIRSPISLGANGEAAASDPAACQP